MARLIRQRKLQAQEAKGHETQQKSLEGLFQKLQNLAIGKERDAQLVQQVSSMEGNEQTQPVKKQKSTGPYSCPCP